LQLRFWGTRGSIATPGAGTTCYGGNTSCVELVTNAGARIIFDCGTGARLLGAHLMSNGGRPIVGTILLSHTHWDHIQGFPFFAPAFVPGSKLTVCGPEGSARSLPDVLAGQMEYTYFPVELGQLAADIKYVDLREGSYEIEGLRIRTQYLNHPAITLGYRVEADNLSVAYLCDHEPYSATLWGSNADHHSIDSIVHANDRRHAQFMMDADIVIHDAQYTPEEYQEKKNWGHSTYDYVVQVAMAARVRKLFLTHHDPLHDDAFIAQLEARAREIVRNAGSSMEVACAFEGCKEHLRPSPNREHLTETPDADTAHINNFDLDVLIVDDDEDLRVLASRALRKIGYRVSEASGGVEALEMIAKSKPDLVLLDLAMPEPGGIEVLRILRAKPELADLPVIVMTASSDEIATRESFEAGATDFVTKPFTPPQLDARVRTCFARSGGAQH
jgi:CheY-like chemotaxis protein